MKHCRNTSNSYNIKAQTCTH